MMIKQLFKHWKLDPVVSTILIIAVVFTAINAFYVSFLPSAILFLALLLLFWGTLKIRFSVFDYLILFIALLRFEVIPAAYFVSNSLVYSSRIPLTLSNFEIPQLIMLVEQIAVFGGLFFGHILFNKFHSKLNNVRSFFKVKKRTKDRPHFLLILMVVLTLALVIYKPRLVFFLHFGSAPSNAIVAVFIVGVLCSGIYLFEVIESCGRLPELWKIFLGCCVFVVVGLLGAVRENGSIGRNFLIINVFILLVLLINKHHRYRIPICIVTIVGGLFAFLLLTVVKAGTSSGLEAIYIYLQYGYLNAYFAGPTNLLNGVLAINEFNIHGLQWLINDLVYNAPIIGKHLTTTNTVILFNDFIYRGSAYSDITPTSIQGLIYFGPFLFWVLPFALPVLSKMCFVLAKRSDRLLLSYPLLFMAMAFSMGQIISLNAISMLFMNYCLPLLALFVLDSLCDKILNALIENIRFGKNGNLTKGPIYKNAKKDASVLKNYGFSLLHQFILLFGSVVVTPHVSRTLTSSGLGQYGYAYSVVSFALLFANLGFTYYAQREIAAFSKNDIKSQSKLFYEILLLKLGSTVLTLAALTILLLFRLFGDYSMIVAILCLDVLAAGIDVSFYFKGKENFKVVSLLQSLIKIVSIICILIFVNSASDLFIYCFCMSGYTLLSACILIPFLKGKICRVPLSSLSLKKHIKPALVLFIPIVAASTYTTLVPTFVQLVLQGKTIYVDGSPVLLSDVQNGYFSQADKIIQLCLTLLSSLGAVMMSRNAVEISKGNVEAFTHNSTRVMAGFVDTSLLMFSGIVAVSYNFSPWFYGSGYEEVPLLLILYAPAILIIGMGNVFGAQCLIPMGRYKEFTISSCIAGIFGAILVPTLSFFFYAKGAIFAVTGSQLIYAICCYFFARKHVSFSSAMSQSWKSVVAFLLSMTISLAYSSEIDSSILNTILLGCIDVGIYVSVLLLFKSRGLTEVLNNLKVKIPSGIFEKNGNLPKVEENYISI